jgi:hypothetical protein
MIAAATQSVHSPLDSKITLDFRTEAARATYRLLPWEHIKRLWCLLLLVAFPAISSSRAPLGGYLQAILAGTII